MGFDVLLGINQSLEDMLIRFQCRRDMISMRRLWSVVMELLEGLMPNADGYFTRIINYAKRMRGCKRERERGRGLSSTGRKPVDVYLPWIHVKSK